MAGVQVKEYLERQWHRILANRVSVQDFVFAKEVRLGTYSPKAAVVPPAAIVAAKAMATDPRAEPRFAERVPYVVVYGEPGTLRNSKLSFALSIGLSGKICTVSQAKIDLSCMPAVKSNRADGHLSVAKMNLLGILL